MRHNEKELKSQRSEKAETADRECNIWMLAADYDEIYDS